MPFVNQILYLINRGSLVAGNFANMRQRLTKFNLFGASQKFGRVADSLDLFRGFDHSALQFDDFPCLVHVSVFNLSIKNELQSLLKQLFVVPTVVNMGNLSGSLQLEIRFKKHESIGFLSFF